MDQQKHELIVAFDAHVAGKVQCSKCSGTGIQRQGQFSQPIGKPRRRQDCTVPGCVAGWVDRQ